MRANAFYTNPRLAALLALFIVIMGSMAFQGLARQEDPTMTERWARVNTFLPGATALRVESLVSEPIETALRELPEVKQLSSQSRAGLSVVSVELYDSVGPDEVDGIWSEVRDRLGDVRATLPAAATDPELLMNKPLASTLIVKFDWRQTTAAGGAPGADEVQLNLLSRVAETLRLKLANLTGTESAEAWGAADEEVLVALDPYRLADVNLTPAEIAARIRAADTKLPSGRLRGPSADLLVEVDAELSSAERIGRVPLRADAQGSVLRVSDVAEVSRHRVDPPSTMALHDGRQVIFVNAKMQPNLQIGEWTARALDVIDDYAATLPAGVGLEVVYSQNGYTGERMNSLGINLAFALVIVLLVLIWFMGVRSALTVGVALPLSAAMVLVGMQTLGIPLHQMSVTGLIISLGLLIDNAIVVVEDYKLRRREGDPIEAAISRAIRHLFVPLGASTATTVFAFMPIAFSPGGVGDFTGTLGVTVALSVASSFVLAMTIIPAVAGFLERRWPSREGNTRWWQSGFSSPRLAAAYRRSIELVLRRRWIGVAVACALPLIGFALAPTLTQQFFPPVDRNQFQLQLSLPAHSSIYDTRAAAERADAVLRANPDITDVFWSLGEGAPRVYYNVVSLNERVASFAAAWVNTSSASATREILPEVQRALTAALPEAEVLAIPFEQGPPTAAPIELRVTGSDLEVLRDRAEALRRILADVPSVTYTRATLTTAEPKLTFVPDENAAAQAGLSTGEIAARLNASLSGSLAGTLQEGNAELDVRVRLADRYRDQVGDLMSLPTTTSLGRGVPLDELGRWELRPTAAAIDRHQGERVTTIQAYLVPFTLPAGVLKAFNARLAEADFSLPAGYSLQVGGEAEESGESVGNLLSMFVFFALAMAVVIILSLNSFKQAALIGVVAILSFGLALFGVRLFGYPFGYMALIGALGMMGLAINGAIIVLSALKADPRALAGDQAAMADVVVDATRHIVSTTATTIGGFVPLIVAGGTFWPPLATAVAGGVGGSALIALYLVPTIFARLHPQRAADTDPAKMPRPSVELQPRVPEQEEQEERRELPELAVSGG
ncbi:MAG: efflux RND transporter permease subunit [Pseudomonadota bacterium]